MRLFFCVLLLSSCHSEIGKTPTGNVAVTYVTNPLDSILGEKVLSERPLVIRRDNFGELIGMPASLLSDSCRLYDVRRLDSTTWAMQYRKHYLKTRKFTLIVKTDGRKIVRYKALYDYALGHHVAVPDGFVFTCSLPELAPFPGAIYDHYIRASKLMSS